MIKGIKGELGEVANVEGAISSNNNIDGDVNVGGTFAEKYELPIASATNLGGIKVGKNLSIDEDGTLNVDDEDIDLSEYAKKEELPTKTSELENDSNYLSSIPDEYITENELNKKGFLTEHQDLSEYAKKEYVDEKIANIDIGGGVDLSEYAKKEELPSKTSQLENDSGYVKNIDYASSDNVGLVKTESYYGLHTSSRNGTLYCEQFSYDEYTNEKDGNCFIGKGTLENVLEAKDYAKKEYVDEKIATIPKPKKFDFPVGFIYMSVEETSPAELFGGIWEQIKDTFLLACGDIYNNGDVGGEAEHTLTINEMPSHTHSYFFDQVAYNKNAGTSGMATNSGTYGNSNIIASAGGSQAHNNMPPYLSVYVWKKIGEDSITNSYAVASAWENYNNGGADGTLIYNNLKLWMGNYDGTPNILDGISLDFEIEGSFNLIGNFNFYAYEGAPRNFGIYIFKDGNLYKELPQQFDTLGSAFDVSINELVETGTYEIVVGAYNNYEFGINSGTISFVEN